MLRVLLCCYLNTLLMSCSGQPVSSNTSKYKLNELNQSFVGMYSIYADEDLIGEYDGEKLIKVYVHVSVDKNNNGLVSVSANNLANVYCEGSYQGRMIDNNVLALTHKGGRGICGDDVGTLFIKREANDRYFIKGNRFHDAHTWLKLIRN